MMELTGFQRDLLIILAGMEGEQSSPQEIRKEMKRQLEADIATSRFYDNLKQLAEKRFVVEVRSDGRTKQFSTTRRGIREIMLRHEWEDMNVASDYEHRD